MNYEFLYSAFVIVVTLAWLLLILAPKWAWTRRIVHSIGMPIAIAVWVFTLEFLKPAAPAGASMTTLQGVMLLVGGEHGTLMTWTMLMGWDLIAGSWLARDALRRGVHHAWVVPCLLLMYFLGIVGLILYFAIRLGLRREWSLEEKTAP